MQYKYTGKIRAHLSRLSTKLTEVVNHLRPEFSCDVFVEPPTLVCGSDVVPNQAWPTQVLLTNTAIIRCTVTQWPPDGCGAGGNVTSNDNKVRKYVLFM